MDRKPRHFDLSEFRKVQEVESGGFGTIDLYENVRTSDQVSVKTLFRPTHNRREIDILVRLVHPCILGIEGLSMAGTRQQIVTEYLCNGSLQRFFIKRHLENISSTNQVKIIVGIVLGMMYVHQQNVAHRDLKPEHILLGNRMEVKICDFGCAKFVVPGEAPTPDIGTTWYKAPEMFLGTRGRDVKKVDVFAFAIVVCEMLFGALRYKEG
jgi:serine/threonine protein kinase